MSNTIVLSPRQRFQNELDLLKTDRPLALLLRLEAIAGGRAENNVTNFGKAALCGEDMARLMSALLGCRSADHAIAVFHAMVRAGIEAHAGKPFTHNQLYPET